MSGGASYWAWVSQWGYFPIALTGLGVFVATIWGINGIIWARRQSRPSKARMAFDYSYGIALDEVIPAHDEGNEMNCLEFRFQIRNVAPGPMKYKAERIDVIIGDRIRTSRDIVGILPRNSWIQLKIGGFEKTMVNALDDRTVGTHEFSIIYGHPQDEYSRRAKKKIRFDLVKKDGKVTGAPWVILEENDDPIA
ncbi:MAG: hypothetical protein L0287_37595 [Anaerolineae bacterium]|nr:hypothetical protein [Anaerolineae bacterium]